MSDSLMSEIRDALSDISGHLENISSALNYNPEARFVNKVAHVLMADIFDGDKLNCIKILYTQMAWPDRPLSNEQQQLLNKVYK